MFENINIIKKTLYAIIILVVLILIYKYNNTEQYTNKCKKVNNCNNCMKLPSNFLQNNVNRIDPLLLDKHYGLSNQLEIDI